MPVRAIKSVRPPTKIFFLAVFRMEKSMIFANSEIFRRATAEIAVGVAACKSQCRYFGVCGGGRPSINTANWAFFRQQKTNYCRLSVQASADALLSFLSERTLTLLPEANPFEARVCPCRIVAPARRAPRGVGMSLDADLPQADVRQSEFLVPVHCPLQTNGRSGHIIELHRSSRGNR